MPQWSPEQLRKLFGEMHEEMLRAYLWGSTLNPGQKQEAHMVSEIPKQDLLAKLLMMTTSSSDGEALAAIRKANNLLTAAGWTWEMLIRNKIKIVENPFAGLSDPRQNNGREVDQQYKRPAPPPPQQATQQAKPPVNSRRTSLQDGHCYCCGIPVDAAKGWTFTPSAFNFRAPVGHFSICDICNSSPSTQISQVAAPWQHQKPASRPNQYPGFCYCCGAQVSSLSGFIFKPFDFNSSARNSWSTLCTSCNIHGARINDHPAKHSKVFKPGLVDL